MQFPEGYLREHGQGLRDIMDHVDGVLDSAEIYAQAIKPSQGSDFQLICGNLLVENVPEVDDSGAASFDNACKLAAEAGDIMRFGLLYDNTQLMLDAALWYAADHFAVHPDKEFLWSGNRTMADILLPYGRVAYKETSVDAASGDTSTDVSTLTIEEIDKDQTATVRKYEVTHNDGVLEHCLGIATLKGTIRKAWLEIQPTGKTLTERCFDVFQDVDAVLTILEGKYDSPKQLADDLQRLRAAHAHLDPDITEPLLHEMQRHAINAKEIPKMVTDIDRLPTTDHIAMMCALLS